MELKVQVLLFLCIAFRACDSHPLHIDGQANLQDRRMLQRDIFEFLLICASDAYDEISKAEDVSVENVLLKDSFNNFKGIHDSGKLICVNSDSSDETSESQARRNWNAKQLTGGFDLDSNESPESCKSASRKSSDEKASFELDFLWPNHKMKEEAARKKDKSVKHESESDDTEDLKKKKMQTAIHLEEKDLKAVMGDILGEDGECFVDNSYEEETEDEDPLTDLLMLGSHKYRFGKVIEPEIIEVEEIFGNDFELDEKASQTSTAEKIMHGGVLRKLKQLYEYLFD